MLVWLNGVPGNCWNILFSVSEWISNQCCVKITTQQIQAPSGQLGSWELARNEVVRQNDTLLSHLELIHFLLLLLVTTTINSPKRFQALLWPTSSSSGLQLWTENCTTIAFPDPDAFRLRLRYPDGTSGSAAYKKYIVGLLSHHKNKRQFSSMTTSLCIHVSSLSRESCLI